MKHLKKTTFLFALCLISQMLNAQNEFISIWQSTNHYPTIEIPTYDGEIYNYNVNWGDGSVSNNVAGDITHNYAATGNYTVTITGVFPGINFKKIEDRELARHNRTQILSIQQWGNNQWKSMDGAFSGQFSLVINTTDVPDLSQCSSMKEMFRACLAINDGTHNKWNLWNTTTITDMSGLFYQSDFNKPIDSWNTRNTTNMSEMFFATEFNQDISNWDVSNVTNMSRMFVNADFNLSINNWNTGNVTNMSEMFRTARFNQPLNNWNVIKVTDMSKMFYRNTVFNQPLNNWNVGNVITMQEMFREAVSFNQPINSWNVSKVTNMNYMFGGNTYNDTTFNQPLDNWVVSSVTDMGNMFKENLAFNQDIGNWDVSNVINMQNMFRDTRNFNQNIGNWNVGKVVNMNYMFHLNPVFNQPIGNWDVSKVTDMGSMFSASNFNSSISNWNVSSVTNMSNMFNGSDFTLDISNWNVSKVTDMSSMFSYSNFNQPIGNWNTESLTDISYIFQHNDFFNQPLNNWDVSKVTDMSGAFFSANSFNQDLSNWNTINATSFNSMFNDATSFNQDISSWNVTKIETCSDMFRNVTLSPTNYDALLIGWNAQDLQSNVGFNAGNSKYLTNAAEAARQNMITNDSWNIYDAGKLQTFTWTGAVSTDWNTPGNWDTNSVPTPTDDVVLADVANAPRVNFNQSYTVNNLTTNEALTIKTNASLTVNGDLDQGANIQVESFVNGNGSFILRGNQTNLNPADLIYLRYISGNNWHLFSSPVTQVDIDAFAAATQLAEGQNNNRGIGFHDNNANPSWSYYQNGADNTGDFISGKGYSIQTSANAFLNFTGKLKADNLTNYQITENLNGWNLVGNPYPANINANVNADANENFLTENAANLDPAFANIYLWNPSTTSYEPIGNGLGAKYIAPGQGFFVKSKNGGGTIDINKSMLTHQIGNLFLKENQPQKIVLKINDNTNASETTIAFKNGMTKGLDITYDAAVFNGESRKLSLYTNLLEDGKNVPFAIQFLPELENNDFIIPLGIEKNQDQEITISLKETTISSAVKIYLEDRLENTFTEISKTPNYTFSHQKSTNEIGRFYLHIQKNALSLENIQTNNINIYKDSESSILINGVADGMLNVYSITGKNVIENRKISENEKRIQLPNLAKGVYLFEVKTNSRKIVKKIIF